MIFYLVAAYFLVGMLLCLAHRNAIAESNGGFAIFVAATLFFLWPVPVAAAFAVGVVRGNLG